MSNATQSLAGTRITSLLDANSFVEIGQGVTARSTDFNMTANKAPSDGVITGYGVIDDKLVYVYSQDASVLNGTVGEMHAKKITRLYDLAMKTGAPVIGLVDCAGIRLQEATDALEAFGQIYLKQTLASGVIPQITAIFGTCGGGLSIVPALTDFTFMESKKGKMLDVTLNQSEGITESSYEETTDNMINKVAIYNSKNKKIGTVSNKNWISTYGTFQDSLSVEKGNGKKEAKNTLTGLEKTASLTAIGDIRCISGYGIKIHDVDSGLDGNFWIENDSHTFENGIHTMTLELAFKNIMETESDDTESSSSSGTVSTGILNGRKVKALFTAYYPASNKMEGGYYDCKGKKLDPSKYTCAAPGSVKYGTQIQVLGTKTSRDKKVHKVNDRGGAIKIVNGVYHFDLLMKTKAQCNRFGKRTGYAIIGNGTGFKQKKVDTKQADKVISKAKKYIGKVNYVFGASSPDLGKSDCSGFTSFVFRKATGKQIGRSANVQATRGSKVQKKDLRKGDLVIFQGTYKAGPSHVGIYIGSNKFIHCSNAGVRISSLQNGYYAKHWMQGRRIL